MHSDVINTFCNFLLQQQLNNKTVFKFRSVDPEDKIPGSSKDRLQSLSDEELLALPDEESEEEGMLETLKKGKLKDK
jgi:hypothetical protein